jgi:hypothetical protein
LCRHDHGLSWQEFEELTLAQLEALEYRRTVQLRHERFNAGLVTSTVINVNLTEEGKRVSAFDFLPGFENKEPELDHEAIAQNVRCFLGAQMQVREDSQPC